MSFSCNNIALISGKKCPYFFDLTLEARAEILEIISLVVWKKLSFHKDIIKLTDL